MISGLVCDHDFDVHLKVLLVALLYSVDFCPSASVWGDL